MEVFKHSKMDTVAESMSYIAREEYYQKRTWMFSRMNEKISDSLIS
jgi:hypothetical protein